MSINVKKLNAARDLIASGWTQGRYASDSDGNKVHPSNSLANAWCALGAAHASQIDVTEFELLVMTVSPDKFVEFGVAGWNDSPGRTQADVLALYDNLIRRTENEQRC